MNIMPMILPLIENAQNHPWAHSGIGAVVLAALTIILNDKALYACTKAFGATVSHKLIKWIPFGLGQKVEDALQRKLNVGHDGFNDGCDQDDNGKSRTAVIFREQKARRVEKKNKFKGIG